MKRNLNHIPKERVAKNLNWPLQLAADDYFDNATIDYTSDKLKGSQFVISNPNAKSTCGCGRSFSV